MWAQLVRDSRDTHDQLKRQMEELAWVTPEEVEEGMIKAFGPQRYKAKYPRHMMNIARLQMVKKRTLGIDQLTCKRWIYRLVEDLVEHHVLMRALDIQLRIFQKEVMQEQWVLAEYFLIHQDGVGFCKAYQRHGHEGVFEMG